jgi:EAL domain-containing protein (putative c-di-GMP-specific phosphodiesterase class I)
MCAELGISSVGERVETEADRRVLLAAGVRLAQGFLFGRPILDETFFAAGTSRSRRAA